MTIGPRAILPVNLRDWTVLGRLPDRQLNVEELVHVQAALYGELSPRDDLYYSTPTQVAERVATGYATISANPQLSNHGYLFTGRASLERCRRRSLHGLPSILND